MRGLLLAAVLGLSLTLGCASTSGVRGSALTAGPADMGYVVINARGATKIPDLSLTPEGGRKAKLPQVDAGGVTLHEWTFRVFRLPAGSGVLETDKHAAKLEVRVAPGELAVVSYAERGKSRDSRADSSDPPASLRWVGVFPARTSEEYKQGLIEAVAADDWTMKLFAAWSLAEICDADALRALGELDKSPEENSSSLAKDALAKCESSKK